MSNFDSKPKILIAEDNVTLSRLFSKAFIHHGYEVSVVNNGTEALTMVRIYNPSLLILDLNLPDISGISVLAKLKNQRGLEHIKVIIVTGNQEAFNTPLRDMVDMFLLKPISPNHLITASQQLLAV